MIWLWRLLIVAAAGFVGTLLVALGLVVSDRPIADPRAPAGDGLDFAAMTGRDQAGPPHPVGSYATRDGGELALRRYPTSRRDRPLVVMLHGSGWYGLEFDPLARKLSAAGLADVVVPDLRGHGPFAKSRGDIAYVGQMEDDIADLIAAERRPGQKVVLLGHSSGGGLAIRFAGGEYREEIDGEILLAPYLKYDAPTARPNSGGWTRVLTRRIIGLSILDGFGIHALDGLTVVQLRFPSAVLDGPLGANATRSYSWRLQQSYAPRPDYLADIAKLPPFLLLAGTEDEAFVADAYQPTMSAVTDKGTYKLIPGVGHLGIVDDPRSFDAIEAFLENGL